MDMGSQCANHNHGVTIVLHAWHQYSIWRSGGGKRRCFKGECDVHTYVTLVRAIESTYIVTQISTEAHAVHCQRIGGVWETSFSTWRAHEHDKRQSDYERSQEAHHIMHNRCACSRCGCQVLSLIYQTRLSRNDGTCIELLHSHDLGSPCSISLAYT